MVATFDTWDLGGNGLTLTVAGPHPTITLFALTSAGDTHPSQVYMNGIPMMQQGYGGVPEFSPEHEVSSWFINDVPVGTIVFTADTTPLMFATAWTMGLSSAGSLAISGEWDPDIPELNLPQWQSNIFGFPDSPSVGFIYGEPGGTFLTPVNALVELISGSGQFSLAIWSETSLDNDVIEPQGWGVTVAAEADTAHVLAFASGIGPYAAPPAVISEEWPVVSVIG